MEERVMTVPAAAEFIARCKGFEARVETDPYYKMYGVAVYLVEQAWGDAVAMANGVSVLLITWNWAFFNRYGRFNFDNLAACIELNLEKISAYHNRDVRELTAADVPGIKELFGRFLEACKADTPETPASDSPVAAGKALHVLCPSFFPLWDRKTALQYVGDYAGDSAEKYAEFCQITQRLVEGLAEDADVRDFVASSRYTLVKLFDEYNYSKYTRDWPV
jgi:hypothetical protein